MGILPAKIIVGGDAPVVVHVPHASTFIPPAVRAKILLDDAELAREVIRLTDWHVDHLFDWTLEMGATMFVSGLSRLVFDPERFADDELEPMAKVGQGVVYTHSTQGQRLMKEDPAERTKRIRELCEPYHEALEAVVRARVEQWGRCLILDCHSFATIPLPSEPNQSPDRPDICIGTDAFHTPETLAEGLVSRYRGQGFRVERDAPFAGTYVPLSMLGRDPLVDSAMIEVRRGLYCDEATGERLEGFEAVRERLREPIVHWT